MSAAMCGRSHHHLVGRRHRRRRPNHRRDTRQRRPPMACSHSMPTVHSRTRRMPITRLERPSVLVFSVRRGPECSTPQPASAHRPGHHGAPSRWSVRLQPSCRALTNRQKVISRGGEYFAPYGSIVRLRACNGAPPPPSYQPVFAWLPALRLDNLRRHTSDEK
jgi:hypothetical protein